MSPTESSNSDEWVVDSFGTAPPPLDEAKLLQCIDDKISVALQLMDRKIDHLMIEMKKILAESLSISTLHSVDKNSKTIMSTIENMKSETIPKTTESLKQYMDDKINSAFQCLDEKIDRLLESRKATMDAVDPVAATTDKTSTTTVETPFLQEPEGKAVAHLDSLLKIVDHNTKSSTTVGVAMEDLQFVTSQTGTTTMDTERLQVPEEKTDSHLVPLLQCALDESNKSMDRNTSAIVSSIDRNTRTMTECINQKAVLLASLLESIQCDLNQPVTKSELHSETSQEKSLLKSIHKELSALNEKIACQDKEQRLKWAIDHADQDAFSYYQQEKDSPLHRAYTSTAYVSTVLEWFLHSQCAIINTGRNYFCEDGVSQDIDKKNELFRTKLSDQITELTGVEPRYTKNEDGTYCIWYS